MHYTRIFMEFAMEFGSYKHKAIEELEADKVTPITLVRYNANFYLSSLSNPQAYQFAPKKS